MKHGQVSFDVLVHGKSIREYGHEGRTFVEGRKGSEYRLRVRNGTAGRVLAVMTVDGLSVMDGSDGSEDGGGYVVEAHGSLEVPGWRLDDSEVAKFVFGSRPDSYAAQTGRGGNVGVIGCAVFAEVPKPQPTIIYRDRYVYPPRPYVDPWPPYHPVRPFYTWTTDNTSGGGLSYCSTAGSSSVGQCSASVSRSAGDEEWAADAEVGEIGTEFGDAAGHGVMSVTFDRLPTPLAVFEVGYDTRKGLVARGIDMRGRVRVSRPKAFPAGRSGCAPPPGWRG